MKNSYDGGGYVVDFGYNKELVLKVISDLWYYNWVDIFIVVLFIEFMLFDLFIFFFCSVR